MKLLGSSEINLYFIVLICSIAMKLSVAERQIKVIVSPQRKMFQLSFYTILADAFLLKRMAILSYFHRQKPCYLQGRLLCNMIWHGQSVFIFF